MLTRLKVLRERAGISQKLLAEHIGVSQQSINKYENHNIEPDIETLIRMAEFFETSVDYLVGHTEIERQIEEVHTYDLNREEAGIIDGYRKLNAKQRRSISMVLENYLESGRK